jgi:zinc transport system substrate-binding protein
MCMNPFPRRALCAVLLFAMTLCAAAARAQAAVAPRVVSSIRPLDLLVQAVAGERVEARSLPGLQVSPHDFVLRPSDLRLLDGAALVVWVGPALERALGTTLERLPTVPQLVMQPAPGDGADPHLWLDPRAAVVMARQLGERLEQLGVLEAPQREARVSAFERQMQAREAAIAREFSGLEQLPFLVMHDGYAHFVRRFGLNQAGALATAHERQPGARAIATMRALARDSGARCLLRSAEDNAAVAATIAEGTALRVIVLDPLAREAPAGEDGFDRFLQQFAGTIAACLRPTPAETAP